MSRTLSSTLIGAAFAQETAEIPLMLLEISESTIDTIRLVNDKGADIVSNGETYTKYPYQIIIPPVDSKNEVPRVQVTIDCVDLAIKNTLRSLATTIDVKAAMILQSDPDTIEAGWYEFTLKDFSWNSIVITGTLGFEDILMETFPAGRW